VEKLAPTEVLIVDDRPENVIALGALIEDESIRISSASSADEALDLLLSHNFGLALLDVQMPSLNGFDLAKLIRGVGKYKNLPIIFVTAQPQDPKVISDGYRSGAVDLLFKPLDPLIVRSKVKIFVTLDRQKRLLETLRKEAEAASVAKGRFLANMSHEIRTPLSAVLGFSEILCKDEVSTEEKSECITAIRRNGDLLKRLIDDILDLSKVEAQRLEIENVEFDFTDLLSDVKQILSLKAAEKGIGLNLIRSDFENKIYIGDPSRIKQILLNLGGNAIKFTKKGHVSIEAKAEPKANGVERIHFLVKDTGLGMNAEQAKRIFKPFTQADSSTTRKYGGTGLGLVISSQIAQAMGGHVHLLETAPGKGTTFEVEFNLNLGTYAVDTFSPGKSCAENNQEFGAPISLNGFTVLVADDSIDNRALIQLILKKTNANLIMAEDGLQALDAVMKSSPDVILMDIQMPEMDGLEATQRLRKNGFTKPIVALTAHSAVSEHRACLKAGCNEVLTKPISQDELIRKLKRILTLKENSQIENRI
jgi:signal transduction histidine kinase